MTEDEAFIRALVDNPGDDTPRLVYADWLDDRDDPRGAYLRAEHEWAATHDPGERETLRQMAKGLDPVWVARVSRPPVGVCVEHVEVLDRGEHVVEADISNAERRIGGTFLPDYRAFLLNYNGGRVDASIWYDLPDGTHVSAADMAWEFHAANQVCAFTLRADDHLAHELPLSDGAPSLGEWCSRHIVIGRGPDVIDGIFLSVRGPGKGSIWLIDTSVEIEVASLAALRDPRPYATDVAELLSYLPRYRPV
ncbi:unnamed protein product [Gemmataceae bacterium]|nr:unnamed protein product [Gemmataceae bacterium]VTT96751.1 unnamed protein product [Gemmataceae bacterium]